MPRLSKQLPPYGQEKIKTGSVFGSVDVSRGGSSTSVNTIDNNAAVVPKKRGRPGRPRLSESNKRAAKLALEKGKESEFATRKSPRTQHVSQTDLQSALRSVRKNKKGSDSDDVCAKCMDDPSVKSCTACGCRVCTVLPHPQLFLSYFNFTRGCLYRYTSKSKAVKLPPSISLSTGN
jgi:hypothetical protein